MVIALAIVAAVLGTLAILSAFVATGKDDKSTRRHKSIRIAILFVAGVEIILAIATFVQLAT
jgi:hypothetical protein